MIQFNKKRGLCGNLAVMFSCNADISLNTEMMHQFEMAGLDPRHPFGQHDYHHRRVYQSQHLCPKRLVWTGDHAYNPAPTQSKELTEFYMAWYLWAINENTGYAIYFPNGDGSVSRKSCTKEAYEAQLRLNAKASLGEVTQLDR